MPKVTIIIPCYNCSDTISRTWDSLCNQTIGISELECIFIDDASSDDGLTWKRIKEIESQASDSVVAIHLDENLKQGGARNVALNYATGKYLQFLDSDDALRNDACKMLYDYAEKTQAEMIMFNHLYRLNDSERVSGVVKETDVYEILNDEDRKKYLNASFVDYGCTNKFYRLDLIKKANAKFAEHVIYEEPLFVYPCFLYLNRFAFLNEALYIYIFRSESTVTSMLGTRILDHPQVQLMLLEYCLQRKEVFDKYRNTISLYFLWSFYCETLCFASENNGAIIPLSFFKQMQSIYIRFFPDWKTNPELINVNQDVRNVMSTIENQIDSQEELDDLIRIVGDIL